MTVAPPMLIRAFVAARSWITGIMTLTAPRLSDPSTLPTTMLPSIEPKDTAMVDMTVDSRNDLNALFTR